MAKYTVTDLNKKKREVEANKFATVGDFVDFAGKDSKGFDVIVLRLRAQDVYTIERAED